jgi:L-fuculose-phosphate aldolase
MILENERKKIVEYCRKMIETGLTKGTGGNISIFDKETGYIAISSSGQDYFDMQVEDVAVIDFKGNIIEGNKKPSSEYQMHTLIYENYPEARSVVHCHSVYATSLSILRENLPASNYLIASGGGNDIKCSRYESFGSREIGLAAVEALKDRNGCLLANHGQITYAANIEKAFSIASTIEECAMTYMIARSVGKPVILDDEEMDFMVEKFKTYGR